MMLSLVLATGMIIALPVSAHAASPASPNSPTSQALPPSQYDALIIDARNGDAEPALRMLRHEVGINPQHRRAVSDLIVIAGRAGYAQEVTAQYEALPATGSLPADALVSVARAYRDQQMWSPALSVYRKGAASYPRDDRFTVGETMVLADSGLTVQAVALGRQQVARTPANVDARLALSYAYTQGGQPFAALAESDSAYALAPQRAYVARAYVFALQGAGLPQAALRIAGTRPDLLDPAQMRRLQGDAAAEGVRMAALPSRNEQERLEVARRALAVLDRQIAAWEPLGEAARGDVVRAQIDRLHVLYVLSRMPEVIAAYEVLRDEQVPVPRYALNDVAGAYLYVRQPERAAEIYRSVGDAPQAAMDDAADRLVNETGLYYAQSESDRQADAAETIGVAQGGYAPWLYYKGQEARMPNDLYLDVLQLSAQSRLAAGDTPAAQAAYHDMVEQAPYNSGLLAGRATVALVRSQPRRAESDLKRAETLSPRDINVEVAQGHVALALQEWRQADLLSQDVLARYPEDLAARRLARAVATHHRSELQISGYRGIASDSAVSGNGDFGIETLVYSPPVDDNWRGFAALGYATGSFEEGKGVYRWGRAGAQWRGRDLTIEGEASAHRYGFGVKPGMRLAAAVDLSDQWQVGASGEIRSRETPLRALTNDVSANSLGAFVRWTGNERRQWTAAVAPMRFSDGNNRLSLGILGRERVFTTPDWEADLGLDLAVSRNTRRDAPYFNPRADLTVLPTLALTQNLYRRYEALWTHTATLGAGTYTQRDFGTGGIFSVGYGHRWQANDRLALGASATAVSRPYDGDRERELRVLFDLTFRF